MRVVVSPSILSSGSSKCRKGVAQLDMSFKVPSCDGSLAFKRTGDGEGAEYTINDYVLMIGKVVGSAGWAVLQVLDTCKTKHLVAAISLARGCGQFKAYGTG